MADAAGIAAIGAVGAAIGAAVSAAGSVRAARATSAAQRAREQEISAQKWEDYKRGVYRRVLDAADGLSSIDAGDPKGQERFEGFWSDLRSAYNQLQLAAPSDVRMAARAFREAWPNPAEWPPGEAKPWTDPKLSDALVEAMRCDLFGRGGREETLD